MNTATLFKFNKDYDDTEQVRLYFEDYMRRYHALVATGQYPYDDSFKGHIPGLAGSLNEDTGIYLLQKLRSLEDMRQRIEAFKADGGYEVTPETWPNGDERRGALVRYGWYSGGTGWEVLRDCRVKVGESHRTVMFKLPRQRQWRSHSSGGAYLFMEGDK